MILIIQGQMEIVQAGPTIAKFNLPSYNIKYTCDASGNKIVDASNNNNLTIAQITSINALLSENRLNNSSTSRPVEIKNL